MPKMYNTEENILLQINLLNNQFLDIELSRSDDENWIPFEFFLRVEGEEYSYLSQVGATFTLYELRKLILNLWNVIDKKRNGYTIERYGFYCFERYFDIIVKDPLEENLISLEVWINMGAFTGGESFGYNRGFEFDVYLSDIELFMNDLKNQLEQIFAGIQE